MKKRPKKFLDVLRLYVKAGSGGMGLPKYGGVGGRGGNVYVESNKGYTLLKTLKENMTRRWEGGRGENSRKFCIQGTPGTEKMIPVPVGTGVYSETGMFLGDVDKVGDRVLVARGGAGGSVENGYSGQTGQMHHIKLELKLLADVGLVGFPNAGKSTLLKALSRARPKIASYPFTTVCPQLGFVEYRDHRKISVADLPGLIEGAWCNIGMGHMFLRHVERTKLNVFIVDISGFRLGPKYPFRSATENIILLNKELELYKPDLVEKPSLLLINKMDLENAEEKLEKVMTDLEDLSGFCKSLPEEMVPERFVTFDEVIPCAAKVNKHSMIIVKEKLRRTLDRIADEDENSEERQLVAFQQIQDRLSKEDEVKLIPS